MTAYAARSAPRHFDATAHGDRPPVTFPGLADHLAHLSAGGMQLRFNRGETIFTEGATAAHIFTLSAGCIRLARHIADGRRHIADFMLAGDIFGLGPAPTWAFSVEAVNQVAIVAYPRAAFEHLGEGNSRLRSDIMMHLMAALARAHDHLELMTRYCARERLAAFLIRLAAREQLVDGPGIALPMGRQDIADHLGLTIETVCRAIAGFKRNGIVDVPEAHRIVFKDVAALKAIATGQPALPPNAPRAFSRDGESKSCTRLLSM